MRFPVPVAARVLIVGTMLAVLVPIAAAAPAGPTVKGEPQAVAELQAAYQKFGAARTWRSRMRSGDTVNTTAYVAPDRFHMVIAQGNQTTEIFMIGREMWAKGGGTCNKLPAAVPVMNPKEMVEQTSDTTISVTKSGPENVEGTPTQTYQLVVESRGTTTRQKFYVATATGLPRRIETLSAQGNVVVDYFDFGAAITINNPPC